MNGVINAAEALRPDGRFDRQELIEWWDQARLANARILLVGAGALGNELLKNLALLGVGRVLVADLDRIENSNLARSVLFREEDVGRNKAEVAAQRARAIYPGMRVQPFVGNVVHDLGLGVFRWADVVLCGLDNREARVAVNRNCLRVGRPWIDGAIERLDGVARFFRPDAGACYECTMNDIDWQMLEARRSCALLTRDEMIQGHTPTTATISSIVAGFQCQEMLKYLHGLEVEGGAGFVINGQANSVERVTYQRKADCLAHDPLEQILELPRASDSVTMGELLAQARAALGADAVLDFSREVLHELECARCGRTEPIFASLGKVTEAEGRCPACSEMRFPRLIHTLDGTEDFLGRTPAEMGLPPFDLVVGRTDHGSVGYVLGGDKQAVLGPLADAAVA